MSCSLIIIVKFHNILIVDIVEKGEINFQKIGIKPLHDMRDLKGTYDELTAKTFYEDIPPIVIFSDSHLSAPLTY